ncbi:sugar phosphate nucleotidyltransferase [Haloplanus aerogenes]|uniref:MobA-like NTP transferase protein n=1 Tax=Haloplanus aerogenes TaxID=660522 RepID=A0A3M0DIG7_9EURY|nr:MobA-like NTP transferase protein [Haloplanus aerogenes]
MQAVILAAGRGTRIQPLSASAPKPMLPAGDRPIAAHVADAVRTAAPHVDSDFAVLNGDNLYDPTDVATLFERGPSVAAVHRPDPSSYGVLSTDGGCVTDSREKPDDPESTLVNAGA